MDLSIWGFIEDIENFEKMGLTMRDLDSQRVLGGSPSVKCRLEWFNFDLRECRP